MAGKIKQMIDTIISRRANKNPTLVRIIKTKLILKGINPGRYTAVSDDDPAIMAKLEAVMKDLG